MGKGTEPAAGVARALASPGGVVLMASVACALVCFLVPPLQASDEDRHVFRAHQVRQGVLVPEISDSGERGGQVDAGLVRFAETWAPVAAHRETKATSAQWRRSAAIDWTGELVWQGFKTREYAPLAYAPAALAMLGGDLIGLSVHDTYYLARASGIAVNCSLLWIALTICRATPIVISVLLLPMSIFQMSCPVIDGIGLSCASVACAAFVRSTADRERTPAWLLPLMGTAALVAVTGRPQGLPILALVPLSYLYTRRRTALIIGLLLPLITAGWLVYAFSGTVALGEVPSHVARPADVVLRDARRIGGFLEVAVATVTSPRWMVAQFKTWVGDVGTHSPLGWPAYVAVGLLLLAAIACSVQWRPLRKTPASAVILLACGVASAVLVILALQLFYNGARSTTVHGIQGRYFLVPSLILAYSTVAGPTERYRWQSRAATPLVVAIFAVSIIATLNALLRRYYGIGIG